MEKHQLLQLQAGDGQLREIKRELTANWRVIQNMIEDTNDDDDTTIPLPPITGVNLDRIIAFSQQHPTDPYQITAADIRMRETALDEWCTKFFDLPTRELFELITASNYLDYEHLTKFGCKAAAELIKGKTKEEIMVTFGITREFTEEEKAVVIAENPWLAEE